MLIFSLDLRGEEGLGGGVLTLLEKWESNGISEISLDDLIRMKDAIDDTDTSIINKQRLFVFFSTKIPIGANYQEWISVLKLNKFIELHSRDITHENHPWPKKELDRIIVLSSENLTQGEASQKQAALTFIGIKNEIITSRLTVCKEGKK